MASVLGRAEAGWNETGQAEAGWDEMETGREWRGLSSWGGLGMCTRTWMEIDLGIRWGGGKLVKRLSVHRRFPQESLYSLYCNRVLLDAREILTKEWCTRQEVGGLMERGCERMRPLGPVHTCSASDTSYKC